MFQPAIATPPQPHFTFLPSDYSRAPATPPAHNSLHSALELGQQLQQLLDSRRGYSETSAVTLRGLARQVGLPVPMTTLWRALAIYRWSCQEPEVAHCRHLRVSHFSVLLGVEPAYRLALLRAAEHERWSRRELQARARALQPTWRLRW
ncbi:MAG: hypothetical protein RJA70_3127 [Pseudomonadota bacterium]|jgi:hypothetical protein